ncbi:MAG: prepilin-type N-terminal cleavage/methylation domain-containing protein [Helicobacteraceae bacterium]|jgi:prepilin-type N-terminal cleavage/methylation domain-containing protein|nr:prepilin-type N-terminal cleavage/methylation domain-containing protein [Helicobacteraceae bacterium]
MRSTLKRGFTLIELIVVIILIGVIYSIVLRAIASKDDTDKAAWSLEKLDSTLRTFPGGYVKLVCEGDLCENCRLLDAKGEELIGDLAIFEQTPKTLYFDESGYLDGMKFPADRCFEMERFENGAISDTLVEHQGRFYRYYAYAKSGEVFVSLEDAKNSLDPRRHIPQYSSEFFNETD